MGAAPSLRAPTVQGTPLSVEALFGSVGASTAALRGTPVSIESLFGSMPAALPESAQSQLRKMGFSRPFT